MPDLTLIQRFGSSVAFNETTKVLSIDLNNLSTITIGGVNYGLNVSTMTTANKDTFSSRIIWALLLLSQANQAADNNDETVKLYMTNQGKRSVTRNSVSQFGYQLTATAYQNDQLGVILDPDNLA
jgi:hypothetical protein